MTIINLKVLAQDSEDVKMDPTSAFYMILVGLGLLGVGALISSAKVAEGVGKFISGVGLFIGGLAVLWLALTLLQWAIKTAVTLIFFLAALALAGYIIYKIYIWIFGPKKD